MEVMGLMLGEFVDDYTVRVIDVFAMPQSGTVSDSAACTQFTCFRASFGSEKYSIMLLAILSEPYLGK